MLFVSAYYVTIWMVIGSVFTVFELWHFVHQWWR